MKLFEYMPTVSFCFVMLQYVPSCIGLFIDIGTACVRIRIGFRSVAVTSGHVITCLKNEISVNLYFKVCATTVC